MLPIGYKGAAFWGASNWIQRAASLPELPTASLSQPVPSLIFTLLHAERGSLKPTLVSYHSPPTTGLRLQKLRLKVIENLAHYHSETYLFVQCPMNSSQVSDTDGPRYTERKSGP